MPAKGLPISASGMAASPPSATSPKGVAGETIDATGLHILPGVIDSQVHFREPGLEHKEDLESGSRVGGARRRHRRVRDAEHQAARPRARRRSPTRSPARAAACIATSPSSSARPATMSMLCPSSSACPAPPASRYSWAHRPATCSSTTRRLSRASSPRSGGARPSMPRTRRGSRRACSLQRQGDPSSHSEWRDAEAALIATTSACSARLAGGKARACAACLDRRGDGAACRATRTSPPSRSRPSI